MPKPKRSHASEELQDELRWRIGEYDPIGAVVDRQSRPWFKAGDIVQTEKGPNAQIARAKIAENAAKNAADIALIHKVVSNLRHRPTQVVQQTHTHILGDSDAALLEKAGVDVASLYADDDEFADVGPNSGGTGTAH